MFSVALAVAQCGGEQLNVRNDPVDATDSLAEVGGRRVIDGRPQVFQQGS